MLIVSHCFGVRSERRLCEEVRLDLEYGWLCRLGLDGEVPDHSSFSKTRNGRLRDADLLRQLFETAVRRSSMAEGLIDGDGFAVEARRCRIVAFYLLLRARKKFLPYEFLMIGRTAF